jgi:hypothetical protein
MRAGGQLRSGGVVTAACAPKETGSDSYLTLFSKRPSPPEKGSPIPSPGGPSRFLEEGMRILLAIALLFGTAAPAGAAETALGTIETRDHTVRILAGAPPRYTVLDRKGREIGRGMTLAEIARRLPDVHRTLTRGLAGTQDARLR